MTNDKRQTAAYNVLGAIANHAVRLQVLTDAMNNILSLRGHYMKLHDEDKETHEEEIENLFDKLDVILGELNDLSLDIKEKADGTRKNMMEGWL